MTLVKPSSRTKTDKFWYRIHVGACPVCRRDRSYRVRVAGTRPADPIHRVVFLPDNQTYCGCRRRS